MIGRATAKRTGGLWDQADEASMLCVGRGSGTTMTAAAAVVAMAVLLKRRRERGGDSEQRQMGEGQEAMQPEA